MDVGKRDKAIARLMSKPKDFTWDELVTVMTACGYELKTTGGSGRKFIHTATGSTLYIHQPHPANVLKAYQVKEAVEELTERGCL